MAYVGGLIVKPCCGDLYYTNNRGQKVYQVYTDGACTDNGKPGASAGLGVFFGDGNPLNKSERFIGHKQSNQLAELAAVKRAYEVIEWIRTQDLYEIYTDSEYVINCLTNWSKTWEVNGWRTSSGQNVKNQDLIKEVLVLMRRCRNVVGIVKVKGHSDVDGNVKADRLAREGARQ